MRIYMQTIQSQEQPLRFYQLHLQQDLLGSWVLVRESGFQGNRGQVKRSHFKERNEAELAMARLRDMQAKRGYQVVFMEGAASG
jgi:predicted DNA-binding WGR domain protein